MALEITLESGENIKILLDGRLDTNTAPELEGELNTLPESAWKSLEIDLGKCEFVSSAGLRVIVAAQKKVTALEGSLSFTSVLPEVMEVFKMTGFDHILTLSEAKAS